MLGIIRDHSKRLLKPQSQNSTRPYEKRRGKFIRRKYNNHWSELQTNNIPFPLTVSFVLSTKILLLNPLSLDLCLVQIVSLMHLNFDAGDPEGEYAMSLSIGQVTNGNEAATRIKARMGIRTGNTKSTASLSRSCMYVILFDRPKSKPLCIYTEDVGNHNGENHNQEDENPSLCHSLFGNLPNPLM